MTRATRAFQALGVSFLLIPISAVLLLGILGVFAWALHGGQFEDLEREGERIFAEASPAVDPDQAPSDGPAKESGSDH